LSTGAARSVLAAKDGSVWLTGPNGMDRRRNENVTTFHTRDGLPSDRTYSLFEDDRGRIWVDSVGGPAWFDGRRFVPVREVAGGEVKFAGVGDHLWLSHPRGMLHLLDRRLVEEFPWSRLGVESQVALLAADRLRGGVWLGLRMGLAYFKDGKVRETYTGANGLGRGRVWDLQLDRDGTVWASTEGGLSVVKQGRVATLTGKNGLPCDVVYWRQEADDGSNWLYMPCGLARIATIELGAWMANPKHILQITLFDAADGVRLHQIPLSTYTPHVAMSSDGKLWFTAGAGISVIDPRHLPVNKIPPPVHIEQVIADDKPYDLKPGMRLPANVRSLRIEYTALSLVAPEKIHFKYKLEGQNRNWHEVINERQATYTNRAPRNYRFRVMASNNSGVWNETGDTLEFSIAPAYYQTNWFRALLAATVLAMMWAAYQFRIRQVQRESGRLRDVIETIPAYVWSALPDGSVDFVNRRWLEFSGFSLDKALGWGWADALHPEDRAGLLDTWRTAIASGEAMEAEARMQSADGQYRWLLFRCVPQREATGKIVKWYGKSMDIEDRKRAEQERRQLETDLAQINRVNMMGELAASIAHEVNQPLTGIVSNGSACLRWLVGETPNLEETREAVRDIVRDGKRAGEVIARIRALTKRTAPPTEKLDLNETIREVLVLVGDEAKRRSVAIRTQFADDLSPVSGDRVQLQQVLLNLVMNAFEAMSGVGDRARQLVITTRNIDPDQAQVTVEDSGVGLDPGKIARIFEPFYTTKTSGMGMGLSISRSILQNHGGRLWATANDGPGTSFHFTLPKYQGKEQTLEAAALRPGSETFPQ
jgi:PAS domain S-box-containing protein